MADWTKTRGRALSGRGVEYEGSERGLGGGREGGGGDVGKEVIMEEGFSPFEVFSFKKGCKFGFMC